MTGCALAVYYPGLLCDSDVQSRAANDKSDIKSCDAHWYKFLGHKKEQSR